MMYKMGKSHEGKRWQDSITTRTSNPKILELRQDYTIVLSKALSMAEVHMQSSCKCVERLNGSTGATMLKSSARTLMRQRLRAESDGSAMCTSSSWKFFIRVGLDWVLLSRYGLRRDLNDGREAKRSSSRAPRLWHALQQKSSRKSHRPRRCI